MECDFLAKVLANAYAYSISCGRLSISGALILCFLLLVDGKCCALIIGNILHKLFSCSCKVEQNDSKCIAKQGIY